MDLVLLPHHNTLTSLQKLQQAAARPAEKQLIFVPVYPLVSVLAHADETCLSDKLLKKKMQALQASLKGASGVCAFDSAAVRDGKLVLPLSVPFRAQLEAAGFAAEKEPCLVLGRYLAAEAAASGPAPLSENKVPALSAALPEPFRAFRLAIMETTPLSADSTLSAEPAAAFSWKFSGAFWVKLA